MKRSWAILLALIMSCGFVPVAADRAHARMPNILNSPGYQRQLEASRKAYADAVAAQQTLRVAPRVTRKKKSGGRH